MRLGPRAATPLFGREEDARRTRDAIDAHRLVTIVGPPGVGKSRLAREVARASARGGLGVTRVELAGIGKGRVAAAIAHALGLPTRARDRSVLLARIADQLEASAALVVLDEAEGSVDEVVDVVEPILEATSSTRFLVTTRVRLRVPAEALIELAPLAPPAAIALLASALDRAAPGKARTDDDLAFVCERLDRLPLALELAAARAAVLGLAELRSELAAGGVPFVALAEALDRTIVGLAPDVRSALEALAVLRAPFDLAVARAIVGARADAAIEELVAASLLVAEDGEGGRRYSFLTQVRERALETAPPARLDDAERGHARWLATLSPAEATRSAAERREDWLRAFDVLCTDAPLAAQTIATVLDPLLVTQGPPELHRAILERALALEGGDARVESELLRAQGRFFALRARHREAVACCRAAVARAENAGAAFEAAWGRAMLAYGLRALGSYEEATEHAEAARRWGKEHDALALEAMATQTLGLIDEARGELGPARRRYEAAAAIARVGRARRLEGIALGNLAGVEVALGELDASARSIEAARTAFVEVGDRFHLARVALTDVERLRAAGELDAAERTALRALDEAEAQGALEAEVELRVELGRLALARDDTSLARRALEAAELGLRHTSDVVLHALIERFRGEVEGRAVRAPVLVLGRGGERAALGDVVLDLRRRGALRRVLLALVEGHRAALGRALDVEALREAAWPGERMRAESGAARVYMSIRRLRTLGLESVLLTRDDGYLLDPELRIVDREP